MRTGLLAVAVFCAALAAAFAAPSAAEPPGREISLPPTEVKDTFFAYVLGIIVAGAEIDVDNAQMRDILTEFKSSLSLPFDLVARVSQHEDPITRGRVIGLDFQRNVSIPIPFSLLFYHPGSIVASEDLVFRVDRSQMEDPAVPGAVVPVYDLVLTQGSVLVDIDDWLEVLLRAYLEDTGIGHIVFFTSRGHWIGMLEGAGTRTGRIMRAYFDFTRNAIVFPASAALDRAGRRLVPDR